MSQVIKIKRGGISGLSNASTVQGELIIATGSIGSVDGPLLLAHGDSLGLVAGRVYAGSSVPTISDSELNGILFYDTVNKKFVRLESGGNVDLDIEATSFSGNTDGVSEGSTNLYFTNARADARIAAASVTDLSDVSNAGSGIIITAGERTQLTTAAAFTASLDANLATFTVPASTTISAFGKTLVDDADAGAARTTLGVDAAGTDNSTDVTLATVTNNYLTISDQEITAGTVPVSLGGTGATTAAGARTALGVDEAGTDNSTNVTLAGRNYLTLSGQQITAGTIDNDDLANDGITIAGVDTSLGGTITAATILGAGSTSDLSEGTNLYYTDARVKTKLNSDAVVSGSAANVKSFLAITEADITDLNHYTTSDFNTDFATKTTADLTENTNLYYTDARVKTKLNSEGVISGSGMSPTFTNLTVEGNLSVEGTLTTVNSSEVNIGDRIIVLNTANGAGDAGIQVHDIDAPASTGSLLYESEGNYWKAGVKDSEKRVVTFNADNPTNDSFIHLNGSDEIVAVASGSNVGAFLQKSAGGFTVSNVVDGGTY